MKKLIIIRHAKSSWDKPNLTDFDRPLNKRGENDAPLMGDVLQKAGLMPDAVITSPANRAQATAKIILEKVSFDLATIQFNENIYEASATQLLSIVNNISDENDVVFIFGHNPGFTYLAEVLSGDSFGNIPTCGVVGIEFDFESWSLISANTGNTFLYDYPKKHK